MPELDSVLFKEIVEHGLREFPNECCGVVAANGHGRPAKIFPARNIDASTATYRIDPIDLMRIQDEIDAEDWRLWAFFHSHTHSEAYPSETDRRQAFYPEAHYLLVSLADRNNPDLRAFTIRDGQVDEQDVVIR